MYVCICLCVGELTTDSHANVFFRHIFTFCTTCWMISIFVFEVFVCWRANNWQPGWYVSRHILHFVQEVVIFLFKVITLSIWWDCFLWNLQVLIFMLALLPLKFVLLAIADLFSYSGFSTPKMGAFCSWIASLLISGPLSSLSSSLILVCTMLACTSVSVLACTSVSPFFYGVCVRIFTRETVPCFISERNF